MNNASRCPLDLCQGSPLSSSWPSCSVLGWNCCGCQMQTSHPLECAASSWVHALQQGRQWSSWAPSVRKVINFHNTPQLTSPKKSPHTAISQPTRWWQSNTALSAVQTEIWDCRLYACMQAQCTTVPEEHIVSCLTKEFFLCVQNTDSEGSESESAINEKELQDRQYRIASMQCWLCHIRRFPASSRGEQDSHNIFTFGIALRAGQQKAQRYDSRHPHQKDHSLVLTLCADVGEHRSPTTYIDFWR